MRHSVSKHTVQNVCPHCVVTVSSTLWRQMGQHHARPAVFETLGSGATASSITQQCTALGLRARMCADVHVIAALDYNKVADGWTI